ncbi:hypothetical protein PMAYCL1PPCAC_15769 [Pristionchus mayeri]|uniref:Tc1-like transposase DDE domain-containing protein n=1 Tax=Pristionchus mayeri TaxID=1317129 RepID=A0AAN5HYI9_9BILA|nr:hypothetical protein PMAYCL1PPCAC_08556 [Pristionchus mayeri]GMR45570.1 hypothetical protein PMAYCL1PPCAC_15766 [Pristionchus mayeri]GMR45574.1 hypothetical protein PMAYCL1PPCAC_15769 [Pristionchus mayeri]
MMEIYNKNKYTSLQQVASNLKCDMDVDIPIGVLRGVKRSLLLKDLRPIKVQDVSEIQAEKRFILCEKWINEEENFDNVVFSDESIFALGGSTAWITTSSSHDVDRLVGERKFPEKVQVWASMSRAGPGDLVFFDRHERLNAPSYTDILSSHLLPYLDRTYGRSNCFFMQDGASSHTARSTMSQLDAWGVRVFDWAPSSPDLNPIEFLWREVKHHLRSDGRPTTRQGLEDAIDQYWSNEITVDVCNKYIDHCVSNIEKVHSSLGFAIMEKARNLY